MTSGSRTSRIILILAAVAAVISIGIAAARMSKSDDIPIANAANEPMAPLAQLENRVKLDPNDVEGWQLLGWSYFNMARYGEAADAYRQAVKRAPDRAVYWSSLGEALVMASETDPMPAEAASAFQMAVAKDPKDARGRYFMAVRKDLSGDHQGSINDWTALLKDTPAGAPWEADLKRTIEQVGQINKIDVAQSLLDANKLQPVPRNPVATAAIPGPNRAQMMDAAKLPAGQQEEMVRGMVDGLEAKLKSNPNNINGWIMLMRSRMTLGEEAKAADALQKAIRENPSQSAKIRSEAALLGITAR
jgi:cytochrome c-type biogenesis protein CcmH